MLWVLFIAIYLLIGAIIAYFCYPRLLADPRIAPYREDAELTGTAGRFVAVVFCAIMITWLFSIRIRRRKKA